MKNKFNYEKLNEGVYDFYNSLSDGENTVEKIINYYLYKINKFGKDSLTKAEMEIFNNANRGILNLDKVVYKKNKVTGDIEYINGKPVKLNSDQLYPGVPFITSKGLGKNLKEIVNQYKTGRCYWDVDDDFKIFYVYGGITSAENPNGLTIWKTVSAKGSPLGAFIVPKADDLGLTPQKIWEKLNDKYDSGVVLDKNMYLIFLEFDNLYHSAKKDNIEKIQELFTYLKNYKIKK